MRIYFKGLLSGIVILCSFLTSTASIRLSELRVESRVNPLGIETATPDFSWKWHQVKRAACQTAYQILVASSREKLLKGEADVWNSGIVKSADQHYVKFKGKELRSGTTYFWKVRIWDNYKEVSAWSEVASFTMGIINPSGWKARWITYNASTATAQPLFRKSFRLKKKIKSALAHISGLGYYELYLNGKKAGDHVLDPGQTNYDDYALYVTYDITGDLKAGRNVVGVMLGDGWYNQDKVWGAKGKGLAYGVPLLICQLDIDYTDGSKEQIISDADWQWTNGPVLKSNVYAGEEYDAQKEVAGWSADGRIGENWMPVELAQIYPPRLIAQSLPPIKRMKELPAKNVYKVADSTYVFDFGQNFAGWTRLQIIAPAGTVLTIRTAEEVFPDGKLDPGSTGVFATKVEQIDKYTCKGGGKEIWEPRFTYHGFRYAEVTGLAEIPDKSLLTGIVVYSSVNDAGIFTCSDEQINQLHRMASWTLISNLHSVPTDCPAREKCGWLGDVHAEAQMSIYNHDMETFFIKYLQDIRSSSKKESQTIFYKTWDKHERGIKPKGIPFMIAPGKREAGAASPDWGTAVVQLPWYLYLYYGNTDILREFYPDMKNWVNYIEGLATDHIVDYGLGDWCPPGRVVPLTPPMPLTSTAFHYLDLEIMERVALLLGKDMDAKTFKEKRLQVREAFLTHFYNPEEKSFGGQTANAIALDMGLAPANTEQAVSDKIAALSKDSLDGFLNTGIFGLSRLFNALSHYGNEESAFSILTKTGYKSFDYMWSQYGATTLWEILPVDSFYLKGADKGWERSHNHPMQGGFDKWFYENVLGIRPDPDEPGFKKIHLEPEMTGTLQWAKGEYHSGYGVIKSAWRTENGKFYWNITIPANTSAILYFRTDSINEISEGGKPVSDVKDVRFKGSKDGKIICEVGSGSYVFSVSKI